jgi:hypothetical protein
LIQNFCGNRSVSTVLGIKKANGKNPVGVAKMAPFEGKNTGVQKSCLRVQNRV